MITITPAELTLVQNILREKLPTAKIWVFGSRAKGTAQRGSDLDLAIDAGAPLPPSITAPLSDALENAPLPYTVDLVDLHTTTPTFTALINTHKIPLPGFE
jgi:predicted nucleotidyltransferase